MEEIRLGDLMTVLKNRAMFKKVLNKTTYITARNYYVYYYDLWKSILELQTPGYRLLMKMPAMQICEDKLGDIGFMGIYDGYIYWGMEHYTVPLTIKFEAHAFVEAVITSDVESYPHTIRRLIQNYLLYLCDDLCKISKTVKKRQFHLLQGYDVESLRVETLSALSYYMTEKTRILKKQNLNK